jgi:hypothetical protein
LGCVVAGRLPQAMPDVRIARIRAWSRGFSPRSFSPRYRRAANPKWDRWLDPVDDFVDEIGLDLFDYFAPLAGLKLRPETELYLGLVHRDDMAGNAARFAAARRHVRVDGVATECSTALSARLDPEDLREVIAAYHRAVAEIVTGFDGFVSRYMGDA